MRTFRWICLCSLLVLILAGLLLWGVAHTRSKTSLASVDLGDGRILQVEGVTYGVNHRIGNPSSALLDRFRPWLPVMLTRPFEPKYPQGSIDNLDRPALVVWVNAINPATGSNVDCQGVRVELQDEHGDLFGADTDSWFGDPGNHFWREGHIFFSYPRTEPTLTMLVTSWKSRRTVRVQFPNPHVVHPAQWHGDALPQKKRVGDVDIVLTQLKRTTNGSPETPSVDWQPDWELRRGSGKAAGWDPPEWIAEDPTGNNSQHLGVHQPVLRFSAIFYPSPTNLGSALSIATLPEIILTNPQPILWWNQKITLATNELLALGFFPPGNYVFRDGVLLTNPPVKMGPVGGGAPSGWTGQSMMASPIQRIFYHGHYSTTNSVIYLRAPELAGKGRLAVRLRDEHGTYWLTKLEPQGTPDGIHPYLVNLPLGTKRVVPELVVLKPLEAAFTVQVPRIDQNPP